MTQAQITREKFAAWLTEYFGRSEWSDYARIGVAARIAKELGIEFAPEPTPANDEPGTVRMSPDGPVIKGLMDPFRWLLLRRAFNGGATIVQLSLSDNEVSVDWPVVAQVPPATAPTAAQ